MQNNHVFETASFIKFSYMLSGIILERVDSINALVVIMDSNVDVTVERALAMLEFVKRLSCEFRDLYTLKTLYVSLVRPNWRPLSVCRRSS
jgi:hypothetical protein